jgi:hypothetical protein
MHLLCCCCWLAATALSSACEFVLCRGGVLVYGARQSGKRSTIYQVADALGVHVIEINCYGLVTPTENKTAQFCMSWWHVVLVALWLLIYLRLHWPHDTQYNNALPRHSMQRHALYCSCTFRCYSRPSSHFHIHKKPKRRASSQHCSRHWSK